MLVCPDDHHKTIKSAENYHEFSRADEVELSRKVSEMSISVGSEYTMRSMSNSLAVANYLSNASVKQKGDHASSKLAVEIEKVRLSARPSPCSGSLTSYQQLILNQVSSTITYIFLCVPSFIFFMILNQAANTKPFILDLGNDFA